MSLTEMAVMTLAHIERVRRLPGMGLARAIIVAESNEPFVATQFYIELNRQVRTNTYLLYYDEVTPRSVAKRSGGGGGDAGLSMVPGEFAPGLYTSEANKPLGMAMIERVLEDGRLHLHRDFVHYTFSDAEAEMRRAGELDYDLTKIRKAYGLDSSARGDSGTGTVEASVHSVLREVEKVRMERLLCKEFHWMNKIITDHVLKNGTVRRTVKISGKGGKDPDDASDRRDDLVMALMMILLGSAGYYTNEKFFTERQRLGLNG